MAEKNMCPQCASAFVAIRDNQRFCSHRCKWTYGNRTRKLAPNVRYNCEMCSKLVERYVSPAALHKNALRFCSRKCKGAGLAGLPQRKVDREGLQAKRTTVVVGRLADQQTGGSVIVRKRREPGVKDTRPYVVECAYCKVAFTRNNRGRIYCSLKCRWRANCRDRDREAQSEYGRRYRAARPEWCREMNRRKYLKNPELAKQCRDRYRARKANAPVNDFTEAQWRQIKAEWNYCCAYCGAKPLSLTKDHVIPLSKGGPHTASNIVPACKSCNSTKWARTPEEAAARIAERCRRQEAAAKESI